jgi:hypothetical protein
MQTPLVVAITGHRDIVPAEVADIQVLTRAFFTDLREQFPELPIQLMSPVAEGAGRTVAHVALDLGIELFIPMPMPRDLYADDFETDSSMEEFDELCSRGEVIELPLVAGNTLESIRYQGPERTSQYAQLGVFLSSHCQILLAVWDGKEINELGGTSAVVRFHLTDTMPGFVERPLSSPQLLAGNENDLVYHIASSRDKRHGTMVEGLSVGDAGYYTALSYLQLAPHMPEAYVRIFHQMESFNLDVTRHATDQGQESLVDESSRPYVDEAATLIDGYFAIANQLATIFQSRVYFSLRTIYTLAVLLGLSFLLYSDFDNMEYMIWVFLIFFAGGVMLFLIARRLEWHRKYLDYRALAEGLRVLFYWRIAGVTDESGTAFIHDNFLQKQDIEVGWIRNVMRVVSVTTKRYDGERNSGGLNQAIEHWIGQHGPGGQGQLSYYDTTSQARTRVHRLTQALGLACIWIGIAVAVLLALGGDWVTGDRQTLLIALMGGFPLIAAVREAYAHKKADKELIKQYRFMHRIFSNARQRLDETSNDGQKRAILRALGEAALDEHAEWILMHRERPLEQTKL